MSKKLSEFDKKEVQSWADNCLILLEKAKVQELTPQDFNGYTGWNLVYFHLKEIKFHSYDWDVGITETAREAIAIMFEYVANRFVTKQGKAHRAGDTRWEKHREYMRSVAWAKKRLLALERAGHKCQLCGTKNALLQVHHNTYENLGKEPLEDLIALCVPCHDAFHNRGK